MQGISKTSFVSIVVPVFEAEKHLKQLYTSIQKAFSDVSHEIIMVNDGSKDNTWLVMQAIVASPPPPEQRAVRCVKFAKNVGQHKATFFGMCLAQGDFIITLDDDLQGSPSELRSALSDAKNGTEEAWYGIYPMQKDWKSRLFNKILCILNIIPSEASSYRIITQVLMARMRQHRCSHLFIEALVAAQAKTIRYMTIRQHKRCIGRSTYTFFSKMHLALRILYHNSALFIHLAVGLSVVFWTFAGHLGHIASVMLLISAFLMYFHKKKRTKAAKEHINCIIHEKKEA